MFTFLAVILDVVWCLFDSRLKLHLYLGWLSLLFNRPHICLVHVSCLFLLAIESMYTMKTMWQWLFATFIGHWRNCLVILLPRIFVYVSQSFALKLHRLNRLIIWFDYTGYKLRTCHYYVCVTTQPIYHWCMQAFQPTWVYFGSLTYTYIGCCILFLDCHMTRIVVLVANFGFISRHAVKPIVIYAVELSLTYMLITEWYLNLKLVLVLIELRLHIYIYADHVYICMCLNLNLENVFVPEFETVPWLKYICAYASSYHIFQVPQVYLHIKQFGVSSLSNLHYSNIMLLLEICVSFTVVGLLHQCLSYTNITIIF